MQSSGKRVSADLTMLSAQEPTANFNSFCCCTAPLKDLRAELGHALLLCVSMAMKK